MPAPVIAAIIAAAGTGTAAIAAAKMSSGAAQKAAQLQTTSANYGADIAAKCKEKGIDKVVFDRAGYKYHGRVSALADGAREAGLKF